MLPRERFLSAIDLLEPDRVPITDLLLDPPIVEQITGKKLGSMSLLVQDGDNPRETSLRTRMLMTEACLKLGFDAVSAISDYSICSRDYRPRGIGGGRIVDEWGRIMLPRPDTKTTWWVGGTIETREDLDNYLPPDLESGEGYQMVEEAVGALGDTDVALMAQGHSGWHMAFQVRGGIDKLLIDMYRRPSAAGRFVKKIAGTCYTMMKFMIDAGVDVLFITDDYADNRFPFMSVDLFRKFELPNIRRIARLAKRNGVPLLKHSDGNLEPYMDDMIKAGIDGIHPLEQGAMDLKEGKAKWGDRICILGNVDCRFVLPMGDEATVRSDVRRCIESAAPGGGYVLASSNSIHANCLVENALTMVNEARKIGAYPG
ncbi:MAG: hypothetical protein HXS50_00395 [Theionarchaea archaeon]|nr:hypothetical protein [Theionarchaea archaeon]